MTALSAYAAIGLSVLVAAASGSGDYELVTIPPADEPICAKSLVTCQAAVKAVRDFGLFADLRIIKMKCAPRPDCFPERSDCIVGYNCR